MNKGGYAISGISSIKEDHIPLISVITVVRNGAEFLQACIDTVRNQEYPNIEHIILDGNSQDRTVDILIENSHNIAFWLSEPDNGIYDAMNKAIQYCNGDWYMFLGVDDLLLPGFSELANNLVDKSTAYYGCVIYKGIPQYDGPINKFKLVRANICHQALLYPKIVFETHQYDVNYKIAADNVLLLRLWKEQKIKFEYYEIVISIFNHLGISGTDWDRFFFKNRSKLIYDNLGTLPYLYHLYVSFLEKARKKINKRIHKFKHFIGADAG
ncbi:glycosyltransferase family 2 protein [Pedobacter nyackensis]|uniref:glycosyltransferase family 2 protein n=1 Tax=Pedobacter nyackensis TaxID=475255 RepID=UPI00292E39C0|nr:glycosyltransferase family 2 protein [Pedobacter nyackensis]